MEHIHLTTNNWITIGCTVFNICYLIGWLVFGVHVCIYRTKCTECNRDSSISFICKNCKYYKHSLAYFISKHPERLTKIGIKDNYVKVGKRR